VGQIRGVCPENGRGSATVFWRALSLQSRAFGGYLIMARIAEASSSRSNRAMFVRPMTSQGRSKPLRRR